MTIRNPPRGTWQRAHHWGNPDPAAVQRLLAGDRSVRTSLAERAAALDTADRHGATALQVALQLGCTTRTVYRRRAARRAAHAAPVQTSSRAQGGAHHG